MLDQEQFLILKFEEDIIRNQNVFVERLVKFLGIEAFEPEKSQKSARGLENISFRLSLDNSNPEQNFVEIDRRSSKSKSIPNWLRQLKRGKLSTRVPQGSRIYNPSLALVQFARDFNANSPKISVLPREQELAINDRYFSKDIELFL